MDTRLIPIDQIIEPPEPVRVTIDEGKLYELRDSIRALGQLQAIIVIPVDGGEAKQEAGLSEASQSSCQPVVTRYEIVAGHRRYLAGRLVPLAELRCDVYEDGWKAKEAAMLAENAFREDITAAEEGWKYCALVEKFQLTEAQLCALVQQKPEYIYARMDMVRADEKIARLVAERKINFGVAQQLLRCKDMEHRAYLSTLAAESGATINVVKGWIAQHQAQQVSPQESLPINTAPDAGSPPVENTMVCRCCKRGNDPQNLRLIYVHWFELDFFDRVMREAGFNEPPPAAAAGGA
jgi:ParB family chromosome partitioning protein